MMLRLTTLVAVLLAAGQPAAYENAKEDDAAEHYRQFTYAWPFSEDDQMRPRGGTTRGPEVTLQREASDDWRTLQEEELSARERDRRAILAMAGPYRTSFDFIETIGFTAGFEPDRPYQSWGTEYIYVVTDEPRFISLQHIIVMYFENENGQISAPVVVKHWRQDWKYEDRDLHVYLGHDTWERRRYPRDRVRGSWSQSVFQVDDSPRYQSIGRWHHDRNHSSWESDVTWRPLPRREFSVRDDYDVLSGTNRHTITPTGWVQEEDNLKLVLAGPGEPAAEKPWLAREAGLSRYERIVGHDWSAGDAYWARTGAFWADVRAAWDDIFAAHDRFSLRDEVDGRRLFEAMFEYADRIESAERYDSQTGRAFVDETLAAYLE